MEHSQYKYLKSNDNYSFFRINITEKSITRISNNKRTFPEYDTVNQLELVKLSKNEWHSIYNKFYASLPDEEWQFEGKWYRSVGIVSDNVDIIKWGCEIKDLDKFFKNPKSTWPYDAILVYNNGSVWSTYISGNYYPRLFLSRLDKEGKKISKWTDAKYCRNIELFDPF